MDLDSFNKSDDIWHDRAKPDTCDILNELMVAESIEDFTHEYDGFFVDVSLKDYLNSLLEAHGFIKYAAIKASGLAENYAFQIFQGYKNPSRDKLLALIFGMQLNLRECQRVLRLAGINELYAKNRRDAIIIFGLDHNLNVPQINDLLFDLEEYTL